MQSEGPGAGYQEHSGGFYIPQEGAGGFTTPPTTSPGGFTTPPTTTPIPFGSDQVVVSKNQKLKCLITTPPPTHL